MAWDEKVTEGRTVQELRGSIFLGPLLFPKDRPPSLYASHHGLLAPFPLPFSFTVLPPICWIEDLNKSFCFPQVQQAAAAGGEKEKGSAGFNWRTISSYDWPHGNMCLSLLITLFPTPHTQTLSITCPPQYFLFGQRGKEAKLHHEN